MTPWLFLCILAVNSTTMEASSAKMPPETDLFITSDRCLACHNGIIDKAGNNVSIGSNWQASMMAHASRDPYWQAAIRRECLEHPTAQAEIQNECAGCHMPMNRYHAKAHGTLGSVFKHLPIVSASTDEDRLAADAISCSLCHQITPEHLGTSKSFTAGFAIDHEKPLGERTINGPYDVDKGRTRVMHSSSLFIPEEKKHLQDSGLCASCHTLYTHTLDEQGQVISTLPEQVPYLEWQHSDFNDVKHCQDCHMPELKESIAITSVLGQDRENVSQHVFRGGNFFMPKIFNRYRTELGVKALPQDLMLSSQATKEHLASRSATIKIENTERLSDMIKIELSLNNLAGHKLPTAYPSRRAWIHLRVTDQKGQIVFESGALNPNGSITGNDNDQDASRFEPHHQTITSSDQVQIYEAILAAPDGQVTTSLLKAIRYAKDNRIPSHGFDKSRVPADIAVHGQAEADTDFIAAQDRIHYHIDLGSHPGPFHVQANLYYQPIAYRWAHNLTQQDASEIQRFVSMYESMASESAVVLCKTEATIK